MLPAAPRLPVSPARLPAPDRTHPRPKWRSYPPSPSRDGCDQRIPPPQIVPVTRPEPRQHHATIPSPLARHIPGLIPPRGLMSDKARYDLTWRELVQPVAVRRVTLAVCGHAVEREIGKRHETLRLLVGRRGMRIAPRQPAPRAIVLVRLATVDHDLR